MLGFDLLTKHHRRLVHCHIAFHAASGLALQVMEVGLMFFSFPLSLISSYANMTEQREHEILSFISGEAALNPVRDGCKAWEKWGLQFHQLDSGI